MKNNFNIKQNEIFFKTALYSFRFDLALKELKIHLKFKLIHVLKIYTENP